MQSTSCEMPEWMKHKLESRWLGEISITSDMPLEKAMAPHFSILAWKIPWTEEPCGLQSMGSLRVGQDWATSLSLFTFMHWRRKWQPTPVFLPGESQGLGAWWAAVYGVAQSRARLKWLSSSSRYDLGIEPIPLALEAWCPNHEEGNGNPLQYSCLENPMDGGAWCRLLSMGSQRVGHYWATSLSLSNHKCNWFSYLFMPIYSIKNIMKCAFKSSTKKKEAWCPNQRTSKCQLPIFLFLKNCFSF